jgi:hypothetical protein
MKVVESEQNDNSGEGRLLIHSDCQKCQGSVMFSIGINGPEVLSAATVTDLTLADTHRFKDVEPISVEEVMQVHVSLKKFKGDFKKAFKR